MTTLHGNIRRLREAAGITASEAANRAGMYQGDWSDLETGKNTNPTVGTLRKIAKALGCTVADLVEGEDAPALYPEDFPGG